MVIVNNIIPFKGYKAINLFGIIFAREKLNEIDINHERIHTRQMIELLFIFFYIWYGLEYIIRLFTNIDPYRNILFEQEAYKHENDLDYLNRRSHYSWLFKS